MINKMSKVIKERPILFSGAMIRAILDGRKTQTRRAIRSQPPQNCAYLCHASNGWAWTDGSTKDYDYFPRDTEAIRCPYGKPGDRLWVRETWGRFDPDHVISGNEFYYAADTARGSDGDRCRIDYGYKYKPSIHMPRAASRITLEIDDIRVERLQDIDEADAVAEGCSTTPVTDQDLANLAISDEAPLIKELGKRLGPGAFTAKLDYAMLWDSINGKKYPWSSNPWLWCISFKRIDAE